MPQVNQPIYLNLQLYDGNPYKYVQALLFDENGNPLSTPSVNLTHIATGLYFSSAILFPPKVKQVKATYTVYNDALYSQRSLLYSSAVDVFDLVVLSVDMPAIVGSLVEIQEIDGEIMESVVLSGEVEEGLELSGIIESDQILAINGILESQELQPGQVPSNEVLQGGLEV